VNGFNVAFADSESAGFSNWEPVHGWQMLADSHFATFFAATSPFVNQKLKVAWAQGIQKWVYVGQSNPSVIKLYEHVKNIMVLKP